MNRERLRAKRRSTRVVATLGPATGSRAMIRRILDAGVDVVRLNFSHGSHELHREMFSLVRQESESLGRPVAILQDLQGIKIRTGTFPEGGVRLAKGDSVRVRAGDGRGDGHEIFINYPSLLRQARPGNRILINDGLIELRVIGRERGCLSARVVEGGVVSDHKGVNLRGIAVRGPALTGKDMEDLDMGLSLGVDYVALSFVRSVKDVEHLRKECEKKKAEVGIIAKIERPEAVDRIDSILSVADGIMVARGDLGVEVGPEEVPLIQKKLIEAGNRWGRTVITATQMLESMTSHATPTRAEVSDVANAVLEGTDAVMLSAETSTGRHPLRAVRMMDRIAARAEAGMETLPTYLSKGTYSEAVAFGAAEAAEAVGARYIVAFTRSGKTARLLSKYRPKVPVLAFTPSSACARRMRLYWGVIPHPMRPLNGVEQIIAEVERTLLVERWARPGDSIVITASIPVRKDGDPGTTNFMKLHRLGVE